MEGSEVSVRYRTKHDDRHFSTDAIFQTSLPKLKSKETTEINENGQRII